MKKPNLINKRTLEYECYDCGERFRVASATARCPVCKSTNIKLVKLVKKQG
jgi:Zn finger protein HypA/HybF involved in hydrogenase expression